MGSKQSFEGQAYMPQEEDVFFDDGREIELLHYIYSHPNIENIRNQPSKVIDAIDEYARNKKYLMNIGPYKSTIIEQLIQKERPTVMVELGGYVGYSAIVFAAALREAGGQKYYSLERNPEFAAVITSLADLAGLSDIVKVVVGASSASIKRLHQQGLLRGIDLLFLDHYKPAYTTDLKLCEELGLIHTGTVLAADNVVKPGNPPYLEYVRSTVMQKREKFQAQSDGSDQDAFKTRTKNQYQTREGDESLDTAIRGNPNITYESKFYEGWEPSGAPDAIEITRCIGIQDK